MTVKKVRMIEMGTLPIRPPTEWWSKTPSLPKAHLALAEGEEGVGKGLYATWVAVQIASGAWGEARPVLWLSSEEEPEDIQNRLLAAGFDVEKHAPILFPQVNGGLDIFQLPRDFDFVSGLVRNHGAGLVVVDLLRDHCAPTQEMGVQQKSNNDETWIRPAAGSWEKLATMTGATVLGLHHRNKSEMGRARSKSTGSGAWRQRARVVHVLVEVRGEWAIAMDKCNLGRKDTTVYSYNLEEVVDFEMAKFDLIGVDAWAVDIDHWEKTKREPVIFQFDPTDEVLTTLERIIDPNSCVNGGWRLPVRDRLKQLLKDAGLDISRDKLRVALEELREQGRIESQSLKKLPGYSSDVFKVSDGE